MTNKPAKPPKPFPWRCHHCFKDEVVMGTASYDAEVRHDGRLHKFTIPQLHLPICRACGEKVFTEEVDDQIGKALRAHLNLLFPEEMRAALERLKITQKEAAERLGIAEATLSRWLTNTQIQSRALDNLLRVFFEFSVVQDALQGTQQDPNLGTKKSGGPGPVAPDPTDADRNRIRECFPHLHDPEKAASDAGKFQLAA